MQLLHIGFVILIIGAVQNYCYYYVNKFLLPDNLLRLKILPPRSFQSTGGASQHRLFFLQSTKGLTFNVPRRLYLAVRYRSVQPIAYLASGVEPVSTLWIKPSFFVATHITASLEPLGNVIIA